jgi:hypothetical protein
MPRGAVAAEAVANRRVVSGWNRATDIIHR